MKGANEKLRSALETIQQQQISRYEDPRKHQEKTEKDKDKEEVIFIDRRQWKDPDPNSVLHPYFTSHDQRVDEDNY